MSIDYAEVERQFLATLEADSGRTLEAWMAAIEVQGLAHRNDVIDWLRRQGFMFSKASWLERIHNNGGRPIYAGTAGARPRAPARPRMARAASAAPPPVLPSSSPDTPPLAAGAPQPVPASAPPPSDTAAALDALIARAKAFRPLAAFVIAEVRKAVPGVGVTPHDGFVVFRAGADFAVLAVSPKELRLGIAEKGAPGSPWEAAKLALKAAPAMTHMVVLTDARQVTPALMAAVARAAGKP